MWDYGLERILVVDLDVHQVLDRLGSRGWNLDLGSRGWNLDLGSRGWNLDIGFRGWNLYLGCT